MIGTAAVPHQTWADNIYMGNPMQFNQGAFFGYTDSYVVPNWNAPEYDSNGNQISTGGGTVGVPTPAPDYTGTPCFIANPCPTGYYCKLNPGSENVQQVGTCAALSADYWTGGAGQYTDSSMYLGMVNPPLVLDPNANGPANSASEDLGYSYGGGGGYSPPAVAGALSGSCATPSVCGYKSAVGNCWCDAKCSSSGDCCADVQQWCSYNSQPTQAIAPPPYTPPAYPQAGNCVQDGGQCAGRCGSSGPVTVGSQTCYCDANCHTYNDCCCSVC